MYCFQEEISDSEPEVINDEEKKQRLLKKIRALGKVSKYYKKAAEHNALVAKLNGNFNLFFSIESFANFSRDGKVI